MLLTSSVVLNKIAISAFSVTFWVVFVLVRSLHGSELWKQVGLKGLYVALAVGGFLTLMLAGSTGGHLAGKRSMLDGLLHTLGINTHLLFVLPKTMAFALLIPTGAALAVALSLRLYRRRSRAEAQPSGFTKP